LFAGHQRQMGLTHLSSEVQFKLKGQQYNFTLNSL